MTAPQVYPISPGWKIFLLLGCGGLLVFSLGGICFASKLAPENPSVMAVMAAVFALFGLYGIIDTFKSRIVLTDDRIEVIDLRGSRSIRREDIAGRRMRQNGQAIILLPKKSSGKPLKIPLMIRMDSALQQCLSDIPDFDAADYHASKVALEKESAHGRAGEITSVGRQIRALTTVTWIDCALVWLCPYGLDITVAVAGLLPVIALLFVTRYPALVMLDRQPNSARLDVSTPLMLPGFVLMLRAIMDVHIVAWHPWVLPTLAIALVMTAAAARIGRGTSGGLKTLIPLFLLLLPYGYSVLALANARFDHASPQLFYVPVLSKCITSGKGAHPEFRIAAWGPVDAPDSVPVSSSVYRAIAVGGRVRVSLHPGAFKLPWYEVGLP